MSFLITQRSSHGKKNYPVGFYGSAPHGEIISKYCYEIDRQLNKKSKFHYTELGASLLQPIIDQSRQQTAVLAEKTILPITFENAQSVFLSNMEPIEVISENSLLVKLFNGPFKNEPLKSMTIEQLYYQDNLLGRLFRLALPEEIFIKNLNMTKSAM